MYKPSPFLKKSFRTIGLSVAVGYLVICILVFQYQNVLLFFPTHRPDTQPAWMRVDSATNQKIYAGVRFGKENAKHIFLLAHGNGGQADDTDYIFRVLPADSVMYAAEYPGYGQKPGVINQRNIDTTMLADFDALQAQYPGEPISLIGCSVGSGPICALASQRRAHAVFLITPYHDLPGLAQQKFWQIPSYFLCAYRWNNARALAQFTGPITIIAAQDDEVIPREQSLKLQRDLPAANFQFVTGSHNNWNSKAVSEIFVQTFQHVQN